MTAPALACATMEVALNRYLSLEPEVFAQCAKLDGRVLALHAAGPEWEFFLRFHKAGVQVLDRWESPADVRISAPALNLLRQALASVGDGEPSLSGIRVEGDADLLSKFRTLLGRVGFEPEEWLAQWVGDGAAHRVNQVLGGLLRWGRDTAGTLALDTAEYLREETRDLAHRADVEKWMDAVDHLRERGDRLAARLQRLELRRPAGEAGR